MQTMIVAELKVNFSEVLQRVQHGEDVVISYGKRHEKVAVLVPFSHYAGRQGRRLGLLAGKASFSIRGDFSLTDEEFLAG